MHLKKDRSDAALFVYENSNCPNLSGKGLFFGKSPKEVAARWRLWGFIMTLFPIFSSEIKKGI
jgi:hypothetical protein